MIRSSDLEGKMVRTESGETLGHVFEISIKRGQVEMLICGSRGFFQRLAAGRGGHRIAWDRVLRVEGEILVAD
jgi:sporulation protein YlmC with PRC-barrel domain